MKWRAVATILDLELGPPDAASCKGVLNALAMRAGDDGWACPTVRRLCRDTGYGKSTVYRALARLEALGWIAEAARTLRRKAITGYLLQPLADSHPGNGFSHHGKKSSHRGNRVYIKEPERNLNRNQNARPSARQAGLASSHHIRKRSTEVPMAMRQVLASLVLANPTAAANVHDQGMATNGGAVHAAATPETTRRPAKATASPQDPDGAERTGGPQKGAADARD